AATLIEITTRFKLGKLARPFAPVRDPDIGRMTQQRGFALDYRAEPPRHGLRPRIGAVDAVNDLLQLEGRKRPVDRGPRGFDGIALAAKLLRNPPADLEAGPARRKERADAADELSRRFLL